jgi:hypothetical protein
MACDSLGWSRQQRKVSQKIFDNEVHGQSATSGKTGVIAVTDDTQQKSIKPRYLSNWIVSRE